MTVDLEAEARNDCAGEGQQQRPTEKNEVGGARGTSGYVRRPERNRPFWEYNIPNVLET
jgi:hypothetical protein